VIGITFVILVVFIINNMDKKQTQEFTYVDKNTSIQEYIQDEIVYEENEVENVDDDLVVLYKGDEIDLNPSIQFFYNNFLAMKYMSKDGGITYYKVGSEKAKEAKQKMIRRFERTFYNFENDTYIGVSKGRITTDDEEVENPFPLGHGLTCIVMNVSHEFAFSKKFDPFPRKSTKVTDFPNIDDREFYTKRDVDKIDLDNDGKEEYIVLLLNSEGLNASSEILLYDSEYKIIDSLVTLPNGYWVGEEKTEKNKVLLSLEDVTYIDLDNDGKMEIFISLPGYEWEVVDILKYSDGKIEGKTNYEVSLST